jgi:hypothetical protein
VFRLIKAIHKRFKKKPKITVHTSTDPQWHSEWKSNENTQLWEHPLSKKEDSAYRYRKEEIKQFESEHFHHSDTAFKSKPIPVSEQTSSDNIEINIPENLQEIIRKNKQENSKNNADKPINQSNRHNASGPRLIYTYSKAELKAKDREVGDSELDFENAYQRRELFTRNEWQNYKKLKAIADEKGLVVCPKVRLFDIIEPRLDKKRKLTYRYKIQAKHVDFVICDRDMKILAILELDDNSHYDPERIKRDDFVNMILLSVGYTVIHTKYIEYNILDML